jgi:CCR4-NOT transcription complex subunit 4
VNKNKIYNLNNPNGPSYSCHITYSSFSESSLAILNLDNFIFENHIIKASFGTTKYYSNFLYGNNCNNKDCLYLHYFSDVKDIILLIKMILIIIKQYLKINILKQLN